MERRQLKRTDLLYPDLSYKINGILFDVFKELGGGHLERYYQKATALGFRNNGLKFIEQYHVPLVYSGEKIGKYFIDFLVEDKIVLELKRGVFIPANILHQVKKYLISTNLKLALIACFTNKGVVVKRILNIY
ncbi:MAG: GxxExxY protein [Patescibacteria group bacterium]|nr:GxxExxY protein [Patescibacteria group bacterium]